MAKILIVDDDPALRVQLDALLGETLGHELLFAANGEAALGIYEQKQPDLVITDLIMPQLNGVPMIEHLVSVFPDARIIAISGKGADQLRIAKDAGAAATLKKPLEREELVSAIDRLLMPRKDPWGLSE